MNRSPDKDTIIKNVVRKVVEPVDEILSCGAGNKIINELCTYKLSYHYQKDGQFTMAVLLKEPHLFVGVSKKCPLDKENPITGKAYALTRAVKSAIPHVLRYIEENVK